MYYLLYRSEAVRPLSADALDALCDASARRNRRIGIRGFLIHFAGIFVQLLEGEDRPAVHRLFADIRRDPRHRSVVVLMEEDDRRGLGGYRFQAMGGRVLAPQDFALNVLGERITQQRFADDSFDPEFALGVVTRAYILSTVREETRRLALV